MPNDDKKKVEKRQQFLVYTMVPFILAIPPLVGWAIGHWLDKIFGTDPYLMFIFIAFGIAAGCREFYRIIKRFGDNS